MTDSKTPEWVVEQATELSDEVFDACIDSYEGHDGADYTSLISQALLSAYERGRADAAEAIPDEIDLYQMLKRAGLRKRADVAKFVARAIQGERQ